MSRIQEIKGIIQKAPQRIEDEFQRTQNTWLECFGSTIFVLECYFGSPKLAKETGVLGYNKMLNILNELKERLYQLKRLYPDKESQLTDEVKQELFDLLNKTTNE